jgi:hypothetical protein
MSFGNFTPPEVRAGVYDEQRTSYPTIAWRGKAADKSAGYWVIKQDALPECPNGWVEHEIQFGSDPGAPLQAVYVTRRLRCAIIAVRKRWIIDDGNRRRFAPWFTPKEQRGEGKHTGHIQVMVRLPDMEGIVLLGLRGLHKTVSWANDPSRGKGVTTSWPKGVEEILKNYADEATRYVKEEQNYEGENLPWQVMWWVDLVPLTKEESGEKVPEFLHVGHNTYVNPYTADMSTGGENTPKTRYVGEELFTEFDSLRENTGLDWIGEWGEIVDVERDQTQEAQPEALGDEEDEIPF